MGRVLLIDSGGEVARLLANQPALEGHRIECCEGSIAALQHLRGRSPDVVVTDPLTSMGEGLALVHDSRSCDLVCG